MWLKKKIDVRASQGKMLVHYKKVIFGKFECSKHLFTFIYEKPCVYGVLGH